MSPKMLAIAVVVASGLLLAVGVAEASITPNLVGTPTPNGDGTFTWTYRVDVAADQNVSSTGAIPIAVTPAGPGDSSNTFKDYFTLFDFNLYTGVHTEPAFWVLQTANVGSRPSNTTPADDSTVINLTWYYTGPTPIVGGGTAGLFTARSTTNLFLPDNYTSDATRNAPPFQGSSVGSIGTVAVPNPLGIPVPSPEPGTLLLVGGGLLGLSLWRLKVR